MREDFLGRSGLMAMALRADAGSFKFLAFQARHGQVVMQVFIIGRNRDGLEVGVGRVFPLAHAPKQDAEAIEGGDVLHAPEFLARIQAALQE